LLGVNHVRLHNLLPLQVMYHVLLQQSPLELHLLLELQLLLYVLLDLLLFGGVHPLFKDISLVLQLYVLHVIV